VKGLIVTADDFGAALEVNTAVETAHRSGILSAASLMVSGAAAADAIARARRLPSLRVGLHLVLVDGRPVLPAASVPHLIGADGAFRTDLATFALHLAFSRRARQELAAEITAQFAAFAATGLSLDHCNAHKHFHLHPLIAKLLVSIGSRFGLRAVRVPVEPLKVLRKAEPGARLKPALITKPMGLMLRQRLRSVGLLAPDHVFGIQWSGQMTRDRLKRIILNLPEGLSEIYLHPAMGCYPGAAPGYRYREEFEALRAFDVMLLSRHASLKLGGFQDFRHIETAMDADARRSTLG
jgi:chitin disaccharide deacetylase